MFMLPLIMYYIASVKCETYNLEPFVMPTFAEQCNRLDASAIHPVNGKCYEAKVAESDRLQSIDDLNYLCSSMLDGRLAFPFETALTTFLGQIRTVNKHYIGAVNPLTQNPRTTVIQKRIGWLQMAEDNSTITPAGDPLVTVDIWYSSTWPKYTGRCAYYWNSVGLTDANTPLCDNLAANAPFFCEYDPQRTPDLRSGCRNYRSVRVADDKAYRASHAYQLTVPYKIGTNLETVECAKLCMRFARCSSFSISLTTGDCRLKRIMFVEGGVDVAHMADVGNEGHSNHNLEQPVC